MKYILTISVALSALLSACATPEAVLLKVDPVTLRPLAHVRVNVGAAKVAGSGEFRGNPLVVPFVDQDPLIFDGSGDASSVRMVTWRLPEFLQTKHGLSFRDEKAFKILTRFPAQNIISRRAPGSDAPKEAALDKLSDAVESVGCTVSSNGLELTCGLKFTNSVAFKYELRLTRSRSKDQNEEDFVLDPTGVMPK